MRVVSPEVDPLWSELDWDSFRIAPTVATLSPHLAFKDLNEGRINRQKVDPAVLEARSVTTKILTLRIRRAGAPDLLEELVCLVVGE